MSYLGPLRLHFAGRFQATVSTVNNSSTNFDTRNFRPEFRDQGNQGSWNPQGDADWRLLGCAITAATMADGSPAATDDPVLTCLVADSARQAPAKLVDLDPQQQMCSMVFGLELRVCDQQGETLVIGRFEPAAFTELWPRARQGDNSDPPLGAFYQSVLTDLEWRDGAAASPMLMALKAAAGDGLLSVKYNVDGYDWTFGSPTFGQGRLVGTLGPATAAEPRHFVAGRQFLPSGRRRALNSCAAVVDDELGQVFLDLGNALPTATIGGPLADIGTITLAHAHGPIGTDYDSVCRHRKLLRLAFGLAIENPNSRPVTRDLSGSARAAILRWLADVGPDGNPLLGTPPAAAAAPPSTPPPAPEAAPAPAEPAPSQGKVAAQARMIGDPDQEG